MAPLVILDEKKLRMLAELILRQEIEAIQTIEFSSEYERGKYLSTSKESYFAVLAVLDAGAKTMQEFQNDNTAARRDAIANEIFHYLSYGVNLALQTVPHYVMRLDYVKKISTHGESLIQILKKLDQNSANFVTEAESLIKTALQYKKFMLDYSTKYDSSLAKVFSKWMSDNNITVKDLVQRYQGKLKFTGAFEELEEAQKFEVYQEIVKDAMHDGTKWATFKGVAGIAVLLTTAGMMVWDIYSSEHKLETATRDAVSIAAGVAGATLGEVVIAALGTLEDIEATDVFVVLAGTLTGIVGGFVIGAFVGALIGLIFASGGDAKLPPMSTDGFECYVSPLPDGAALARQIAHSN